MATFKHLWHYIEVFLIEPLAPDIILYASSGLPTEEASAQQLDDFTSSLNGCLQEATWRSEQKP